MLFRIYSINSDLFREHLKRVTEKISEAEEKPYHLRRKENLKEPSKGFYYATRNTYFATLINYFSKGTLSPFKISATHNGNESPIVVIGNIKKDYRELLIQELENFKKKLNLSEPTKKPLSFDLEKLVTT